MGTKAELGCTCHDVVEILNINYEPKDYLSKCEWNS
jgi:hypothetical protein